jgi:hypothetical protein
MMVVSVILGLRLDDLETALETRHVANLGCCCRGWCRSSSGLDLTNESHGCIARSTVLCLAKDDYNN